MVNVIKNQVYRIRIYYGASQLVETDSVEELARHCAYLEYLGANISSVTEVYPNAVNTPKVAIHSMPAYKAELKRLRKENP